MNDNEVVTVKFLRDALDWHRMLLTGGIACSVHGLELQQEMDEEYPAEWMAILYEIGQFGEEKGNPYMEGYNAFHDDVARAANPYSSITENHLWAEWHDGWATGEEGG